MKKILLPLLVIHVLMGCNSKTQLPPAVSFNRMTQQPQTEVSEKMHFWMEQKKGSNCVMRQYRTDYFSEARNAGLQYIRFGPNFLPAHEKDFLFGDLDHFKQINREDLQLLLLILDDAYENGIGIVLTMFDLPGQRYGNPDETEMDTRLWQNEKYWTESFDFWKQLAALVKDHPAIVAYNPINEPVAAYTYGYKYPSRGFRQWLKKAAGTAADLNLFNTLMIQAIREVDPETPIMLDGYFWSSPSGMPYMEVQKDPNILYAFHNPGPWNFSSLEANQGRYSYPDAMPRFWTGSLTKKWQSEDLESLVDPVESFIRANEIEEYRIIASEFWCNRRINGCAAYLQDLMDLYDRNNWHWGFWSFRPDSGYTGYDYQLGDAPDSGNYIVKTMINHEDPESARNRSSNPVWNQIYFELNQPDRIENNMEVDVSNDRHDYKSDLKNEEWLVRDSAVLTLAKKGEASQDAVAALIPLLHDEEWIVRRSTVYALSKIIPYGNDSVWDEIAELKNDPEKEVRIEVALALGRKQ